MELEMSDDSRRYLNPETIAHPTGYTHIVESTAKRMVFISGQVPLDLSGNLVGDGNMGAQAGQVFVNLKAALDAVGGTFDDVVKFTFFLVDIGQLPAVRSVRDRYVNPARLPASSAVEVRQLFRPGILLEIEAIAMLD
jgi:enamine deaminase RidA (YjgF/YER057c/UK114 family)